MYWLPILVLVSFVLGGCGSPQDDVLICKRADSLFSKTNAPHGNGCSQPSSQLQGPRGKAGPRGRSGLPGTKGSPGTVDYDRITENVNAKIENAIGSTHQRIMAELEAMDLRLRHMNNKLASCQEEYDGKCFWITATGAIETNFTEAEKICRDRGARLADIYSIEHFNRMQRFVRNVIIPSIGNGYVNLWLGMKYDTQTGTLLHSNGEPASFVKWYPGYPKTGPTQTIVLFNVNQIANARQGMHNAPVSKSETRRGLMCEI